MPISIRTKLKSRKGASITFALLAFLVCAVIGTVVIAAASAAGGRVKDLAEMDQRYYAVTSAAQLFKEELDNQTFTIERVYENTTTTATSYSKNLNGDLVPGTPSVDLSNVYEVNAALPTAPDTLVSVSAAMTKDSLLTDAALHYVLGEVIENADWGTDAVLQLAYENSAHKLPEWKMTVTASNSGSIDYLTVLVDGSMKADGSIELKFTNAVVADDGTVSPADDPFTVILTLKASVQDNSSRPDNKVDTSSVVTPGATTGSYTETITRTTTKTKTTVITWTASEIKKKVS